MKLKLCNSKSTALCLLSMFFILGCSNPEKKESENQERPITTERKQKQMPQEIETLIPYLDTNFVWTKEDTLNAARKWFLIEKLYVTYINEKFERINLRAANLDSNAKMLIKESIKGTKSLPIDSLVGDAYMKAYRYLPRSDYMTERLTWAIDIEDSRLAFFTKYLIDNKMHNIRAGFAQYDFDELELNNTTDTELERKPDMNDRYTLIIGTPKTEQVVAPELRKNRNTYKPGVFCFKVNGVAFYDDWHNEWPPHN